MSRIDSIRDRCRIDEETGCWHWTGAKTPSGTPWICMTLNGKRKAMHGRRAALAALTGKDLPRGHVAWPRTCCHSIDCVNPEHAASGTRKQWGHAISLKGILKTPAKRASAIKGGLANAAKVRRFTDEQVIEIRKSEEDSDVLANRFETDRRTISRIKLGQRYSYVGNRTEMPGASVFSWRP